MRRLFEGGAYLKIGRDKERKALKTDYLHKELEGEERSWACGAGKVHGLHVTTELRIARILDRELNGRAAQYNHFELKNIAFDEKNYNAVLGLLCSGFLVIRNSLNKRRIGNAALIRGRHLLTFLSQMRRLFEGGAFSGAALIRVNTVFFRG